MSGGPRRQTGRERPSTGPAAGPPGTEVLVVEDSATQAEELRQLLEDHGYAVTVAGDGHTALAAARTRRPALVVSDIVMPETDGYALCRAFKADEGLKDVPVILLTVLSTPHDILKGLECGADNFVTKPYRAENLLSLIGYVLANRELRRGGRTQMGVEIVFGGQKYFITSERQQILDLLLSTYETAIERNDDLARVQKELQALNEQLEERVRQRTAELTGEIAERRRVEQTIERLERQHRLILDSLGEGVYGTDPEGRAMFVNPAAARMLGYEPEELIGQPMHERIHHTRADGAAYALEHCPVEAARRDGDVRSVANEMFWRRDGTAFPVDYVAAPLREGAKTVGAVVVFRDITEQRRAEAARQNYLERMRKGLKDTIRAVAATVEMRDPYTAGHQRRVADLASAIGRELKLPEDQVHGIYLAAIVHDLGKIHVPAEILSKPGRLSENEFNLVKTHPQVGYDVLKDIEFPWPIAQIVFQHHERLDGSGYPRGLAGADILPEARILAVADVVEAMSSHRPYRPGLGIDRALAQLRERRGSHYDPEAVDACLALFERRAFAFERS